MNIQIKPLKLFNAYSLKSTQDRIERQEKRDNQIAFFEQRKEDLKNMKTGSLDDIARKLELLRGYNDGIAAAKMEYNHSQMFHITDEALERAQKIAEEAEKLAPKTPEERREDLIEEATGIDKDEGILSETMDELAEAAEEMTEELTDELEEMTEEMETVETMETEEQEQMVGMEDMNDMSFNSVPEKYRPIDYRI